MSGICRKALFIVVLIPLTGDSPTHLIQYIHRSIPPGIFYRLTLTSEVPDATEETIRKASGLERRE